MKKLTFILLLLLLHSKSFGQENFKESYKRLIVEDVLELTFIDNEIKNYSFVSTIEKSLNWCINTRVSKKEHDENKLSSKYKDESLNFVVESINEILNRGVFNDIVNECGYKCIMFKISYKIQGLDYVNFIYKVDINDLKKYNESKYYLKSIIKECKIE